MDAKTKKKNTKEAEYEISFLNPEDGNGKSVPLTKPLSINGEPLEKIIVPIRVTGELEAIGRALGSANSMTDIVAAYCELDVRIVKALVFDDFDTLQEAVLDFLPREIREQVESSKNAARRQAELNEMANLDSASTGEAGD